MQHAVKIISEKLRFSQVALKIAPISPCTMFLFVFLGVAPAPPCLQKSLRRLNPAENCQLLLALVKRDQVCTLPFFGGVVFRPGRKLGVELSLETMSQI